MGSLCATTPGAQWEGGPFSLHLAVTCALDDTGLDVTTKVKNNERGSCHQNVPILQIKGTEVPLSCPGQSMSGDVRLDGVIWGCGCSLSPPLHTLSYFLTPLSLSVFCFLFFSFLSLSS